MRRLIIFATNQNSLDPMNKEEKIIFFLALASLLMLIQIVIALSRMHRSASEQYSMSEEKNGMRSISLIDWLNELNLTKNCLRDHFGDKILFKQFCQQSSIHPNLFRRRDDGCEIVNEDNLESEKQFWIHHYIHSLSIWQARRFREMQLAKKWAFIHQLDCDGRSKNIQSELAND